MERIYNFFSIGVGGQGVISATQILAKAALLDGFQVRTAETHGMAQRGGSVSAYLRFGHSVHGPLIPAAGADLILSFELSETLRSLTYAHPKTAILINQNIIPPISLYQDRKLRYPSREEITEVISKITPFIHLLDADGLAKQAGTARAANVVMLGVIFGAALLPLSRDHLVEAMAESVPKKALDVNKQAFDLGVGIGQRIRMPPPTPEASA